MIEDKKLKRYLVLQSFCPLFLLIFIQNAGHFDLVYKFLKRLLDGDVTVFKNAVQNVFFGNVVIMLFCIAWFIITAVVAIGFKNIQNYDSRGETIKIVSEKKDSGVTFLVSFVLPLMVDDVSTFRGFLFFSVLLWMMIFLLMRSDLFYQNPVLVALKYKTYEFQFDNPYIDIPADRIYIGISKGGVPFDGAAIKRKYISDGVFLISNDMPK